MWVKVISLMRRSRNTRRSRMIMMIKIRRRKKRMVKITRLMQWSKGSRSMSMREGGKENDLEE